MHGMSVDEEIAYWRGRAKQAEKRLAAIAERTNEYFNGEPVSQTDEAAHARAKSALRAIAAALKEPF